MNIDSFLVPILEEWSMRVPHGGVRWDTSSREDMKVLLEIMIEVGIPEEAAEAWIANLITEAPDPNAKVTYQSTNGRQYTTTYKNAIKNKKDHPAYIAAMKLRSSGGGEDEEEKGGTGGTEDPIKGGTVSDQETPPAGPEPLPDDPKAREKEIKKRAEQGDVAAMLKVDQDKKEKDAKEQEGKVPPGELSDKDNQDSDGEIKQKALETGYRSTRGFKPAPGNSKSLFNEIMSGEAVYHLEKNPRISEKNLTQWIYDQTVNTRAGKDLMGTATKRSGDGAGLNSSLYAVAQITAKSARAKFKRSEAGKKKLTSMGIFEDGETTTTNFYGHSQSLAKQKSMVRDSKVVYTPEGVEMDKDEVLELIDSSGKKDNPSDTATFVKDKKGNLMVMFHSDKMSTTDPQANSTPASEYSDFADRAKGDPVIPTELKDVVVNESDRVKQDLQAIESQLVQRTVDPVANVMMLEDQDFETLSAILKNNKDFNGKKASTQTRKELATVTKKFAKLQKKVDGEFTAASQDAMKYLPYRIPSYDEEPPTEQEALMGFLNWASNNPNEVSVAQSRFLLKVYGKLKDKFEAEGQAEKASAFDVDKKIEEVRIQSVNRQREYISELNKRTVTTPDGTEVPLGDYVEAQNTISKLHLDVIDPSDSIGSGVAKHKGVFSVNMGGTVVDDAVLKKCLGVDNTEQLTASFGTDAPQGDGLFRNENGEVTGRTVIISSVGEGGKKKPIAAKVQRSKKGATGKLATVYYWSDEMQNCFKKNG